VILGFIAKLLQATEQCAWRDSKDGGPQQQLRIGCQAEDIYQSRYVYRRAVR
jgi:hypothetical protein